MGAKVLIVVIHFDLTQLAQEWPVCLLLTSLWHVNEALNSTPRLKDKLSNWSAWHSLFPLCNPVTSAVELLSSYCCCRWTQKSPSLEQEMWNGITFSLSREPDLAFESLWWVKGPLVTWPQLASSFSSPSCQLSSLQLSTRRVLLEPCLAEGILFMQLLW